MNVTPIENIVGTTAGRPNLIIYLGPNLDMDGVGSPITIANTYTVDRFNTSTGAKETYTPGGGSNTWTILDAGYGGVQGRTYIIHAKADFVLPHCVPGERVVDVP